MNHFRRKTRHFPGRERLRVLRERPVEPVPLSATGESEPFSPKFPALSLGAALSLGVEMASAAREDCRAGTPAGRGGKCTVFAGIPGTFPGGRDCECCQRGLWSRCPCEPRGKVNRFRGKTRHFPGRWEWQMRRERPVEPVPLSATGESEPFSQEFPALSPEAEMASAAREACGADALASQGGK